jgi:hypothetical protein
VQRATGGDGGSKGRATGFDISFNLREMRSDGEPNAQGKIEGEKS